jgi:hypothetical protein
VFAVDIETCPVPGCGGRMRLVEIATDPKQVAPEVRTVPGSEAPGNIVIVIPTLHHGPTKRAIHAP